MSSQVTRFRRELEYDGWANAAALASLADAAPAQALRWLAHILAAEWLWLSRLRDEPTRLPVWPDLSLEQCADQLTELQSEWMRYLAEISEDDLTDGVAYRNSRGEFWTSTVGDILTHVVTHAAYHRGQIASAVRASGGTPAYTDFIHAVRQGLIE